MSRLALSWGDRDHYLGPLTYSYSRTYRSLAVVLASGDGDEHPGCGLRASVAGHTIILRLPPVVRPWQTWVSTAGRSWSKGPDHGFWDRHSRKYGFSYGEGFLQVFLGAQTGDSSTTQDWSKFLPWTQWRHVRHSLYDLEGEQFWSSPPMKGSYEDLREARESSHKAYFNFIDQYDGELLVATVNVEEREWRFGEGWFKWLSLFRKPKIRRSLDISFSGEVGDRKGSWKGGTLGTGCDMVVGETPAAAFRRYCDNNRLIFVGPHIQES